MDFSRMTKTQLIEELKSHEQRIKVLESHRRRLREKDQALRQSEEMFRLISENAGDLIAVLDLKGRRIYNSPSYRDILGDPDGLKGTNSFGDIHPEDQERIRRVFDETIRTGVGQRSEYRFLLKDGSVRYIESMGNLIRDGEGNPSRVVVVSRDVTEQRFSDRKIRLLAQTVASTKDGVAISDLDGKMLFVNDALQELYGYGEDELIGHGVDSILVPRSAQEFKTVIRPSTVAGGWNGVVVGRRKDGTTIPVELWTSLVRNEQGEPVAIVGVARDITDRQRGEHVQQAIFRISEAAQSDQSFEHLLRSIHEIIGEILPAENFYIALYDKATDLLTFPYFVDQTDPAPGPKYPGKGLTEYVLRTGRPLLATPERFKDLVRRGEVEEIGAPSIDWLGIPLNWNDTTIGALVLQSYSENLRFTHEHIQMLTFVSSQVAMAIMRRRALESLRESEARFRAVFERAGIGMALTDTHANFLEANAALQRMLGYTNAELRELGIARVTHPEDLQPEVEHFDSVIKRHATGEFYSAEKRYLHKDGSIVWGQLTASLIWDEAGTPHFGIGMVEDITQRKRAEERLSKLNECFLSFGPDPMENINRLTALCGELMEADSALYNRIDAGMLCSWGQWHTPAGYVAQDRPEGHICYDVIRKNGGELVVLRDLENSPYATTDPNVTAYGLKTYIGHPVHLGNTTVGSLCLVYGSDRIPSDDERRLIGILASAISVEERRLMAVENLSESEVRYRSLFEGANDGILLMRGEQFIDCNQRAAEMFGMRRQDILGKAPFELSPESQPQGGLSEQSARDRITAALSGTPQHFEWKHKRDDGLLFDAEVSLNRLNINGETILQAIVRDITERKRAEEALRESEVRFSILAEAAFEGIGISDSGKILIASNQLAQLLGYEPGEMVGMNAMDFVAPESRELVSERLASGDTSMYEHLALRKDGARIHVEVRARALPFKGRIVRVTAIRDVTAQKAAQVAVENSEKRFRALIEHSSEAIGLVNKDGRVIYESPASRRMLGYPAGFLVGKPIISFVHEEEREEDLRVFSQLMARPGAGIAGEFRFRHFDGTWRWLDVVATNLLQEPAVQAIVLNYRNITERKQAEEELHRSRQMLRLVLDNIPQRVFWKNRNFEYAGCNKPFAMDAGIGDPLAIIGKTDSDLPWKEIAPIYRADDADVMESNHPKINYEEPQSTADGETLWLKTSKIPMHDQEGNVIGVLGTYEDITERKRAQEEILLQKTRFQQLYENVSLGIAMLDQNDNVLQLNPAFTRIFQYTPDDLLGRNINAMIVPPEYADEGATLSSEVLHGQPIEREGWRRRKDGTLAYVRIYGVPITSNDTVIGIYGIYEDISERKRSEEKMREQAALLDVSHDAIYVLDLSSAVIYWNKGAERLYGIPAAESIGQTGLFLYSTDRVSEREAAFKAAIADGEWSGELHQITAQKKEVIVQSRWSLVRDSEGRPKSVLVVNRDITEKKKLEAQFHHAQRLETIGTLAGGIAHDLNNVLAPILMSTELLQNKAQDDRTKRLAATIETSAKRGSDIVKQVLTFARGVEGERVTLQPKHLIRDLERIAIETFPKSIEIRSDILKNLWTVQGDATQLHQVLLNLCINARDAMPQGGTLELRAWNAEVDEVQARSAVNARPGKYVAVAVTDSGVGIPAEIMEKIFDPFFTTKEVGKGTGLGLSTALGIVESHKGFITVTSEWGRGSEFTVFIPALPGAAVDDTAGKAADLPCGNGESILVVDDEEPIRLTLRETLESFGYSVLEARDGMEAAVVYEKHRGDIKLVLTDLMMPTMDGAAVIRLLRRMNPAVKIIVVSGMADEEQISETMKKNIQGFLPKPFRAEKLLKLIESALKETRN